MARHRKGLVKVSGFDREEWMRRRAERMGATGGAAAARPSPMRMAVVVVWLAIGAAVGWVAHERLVPAARQRPPVVRAAAEAHATFAALPDRPVEMAAGPELLAWLSERLGAPVAAPALDGHELLGGRLLPGPAALLVYQAPDGGRVSLWAAPAAGKADGATVRAAEIGGTTVLWWRDGALVRALAGGDHDRLQRLAAQARG